MRPRDKFARLPTPDFTVRPHSKISNREKGRILQSCSEISSDSRSCGSGSSSPRGWTGSVTRNILFDDRYGSSTTSRSESPSHHEVNRMEQLMMVARSIPFTPKLSRNRTSFRSTPKSSPDGIQQQHKEQRQHVSTPERNQPAAPPPPQSAAGTSQPTVAAPTRSNRQFYSWFNTAMRRDKHILQLKAANRIFRGPVVDMALRVSNQKIQDHVSLEDLEEKLPDLMKALLAKLAGPDLAGQVASAHFLGGSRNAVKVIFRSANAITAKQYIIKQNLHATQLTWGQEDGDIKRWAVYMDADLTKVQQAVRTSRRPTYDYLRRNKPNGILAVRMDGCYLLVKYGQNKSYVEYEGPWYTRSELGMTSSITHPFVTVAKKG